MGVNMGLHPRGMRAIRYPTYILLSIGLAQSALTQVVIREQIALTCNTSEGR